MAAPKILPEGRPVLKPVPDDALASGPADRRGPEDRRSGVGAHALLQIEADARRKTTERELAYHIVNESRQVVAYRQAVLLKRKGSGTRFRVDAISSVAAVDRNVPVVRWFERITSRLAKDAGPDDKREFHIPAYCDEEDTEASTYPFPYFLWVPMKDAVGYTFAGLLLARDEPWQEKYVVVAERLSETYSHAWWSLKGKPRLRKRGGIGRWGLGLALLAALALGFIQLPMTTLAPLEIVADQPFNVTSPIEGVVEEILVSPNEFVTAGTPLLRFVDTKLRNEYEVAERDVQVAEARYQRASQEAFRDPRAKREVAISRAELGLARAERDYARDRLNKVELMALQDGIAIYTDKRDWEGRPVAIGEQIIQIARPDEVEIVVSVPVGDSIALQKGARIKVFLDSDPLNPLEAELVSAAYHAKPTADGVMAYRVRGRIKDQSGDIPRIGARGSAQLFGDDVPLYFYLFRRPIAAFRQYFGL